MKDTEKLLFKLHAQTNGFSRKVARANKIIAHAFAIAFPWSLSFSGGKDSTVLLDLLVRSGNPFSIVWFDNGWDYPETLEFLKQTESRLNTQIIRITFPASSSFWRDEMPYRHDDPNYDHISHMTERERLHTFTGSFVGMRKEESGKRHTLLTRHGSIYYHETDKQWICCPLADWSTIDIWSYIVSQGLSYNSVYDKLSDLGVPIELQRVGPLTAWQVWRFGALVTLRRGWMDLYNRFMEAFPEARRYA